jgi:hypothetical protein
VYTQSTRGLPDVQQLGPVHVWPSGSVPYESAVYFVKFSRFGDFPFGT